MRYLLIICATAALSACANTEPERTQLSDSGVTPPGRWQVEASTGGKVGENWLIDLGDPSLTGLVEEALAHDRHEGGVSPPAPAAVERVVAELVAQYGVQVVGQCEGRGRKWTMAVGAKTKGAAVCVIRRSKTRSSQ